MSARKNGRGRLALSGGILALSALLSACGSGVSASKNASSLEDASAHALPLRAITTPYTAIGYNPFASNFIADGIPNVLLPLANELSTTPPVIKPILASRWKIQSHSITFYLRRNARWQNGTPVTSDDVVTTLLLDGEQFNGEWASIAGLKTPNRDTVVVDLQAWAVPENVLLDLVGTWVVPKTVYSRYVAPHAERDIEQYWKLDDVLHPTASSEQAASSSNADKSLSSWGSKLVTFSPKSVFGDGPYRLTRASLAGLEYSKWAGFYDAKAIRVPEIQVIPMQASDVFGALVNHRIDLDTAYSFSDPQVQKLDATPQDHYVYRTGPQKDRSLIFHETDYPFNLLGVRKAIAYVINRVQLSQESMGGTLLQNPPVSRPSGLPRPMAQKYLTKAQYDSLNAYNYDPAKATSLLKGLGFTKRQGKWYTPRGHLFKFLLYEPGGDASDDTEGIIMAGQLKKFGISVSVDEPSPTAFTADWEQGDYPVAEAETNDEGGPQPLTRYDSIFVERNYPISYTGVRPCKGSECESILGMNPIQVVPGLGRVNIETTINTEQYEAPESKWSALTWDWARFYNEELPDIPLYTNSWHQAYTTTRYVDWPPKSSALWTTPWSTYFQLEGFLKPRGS